MAEAIRRGLLPCSNCQTEAEECKQRMDRAVDSLAVSVRQDKVLSGKVADRNACCQYCKHVVRK